MQREDLFLRDDHNRHAYSYSYKFVNPADVGLVPSGFIKMGFELGEVTKDTLHKILPQAEPLMMITMDKTLLAYLMKEGAKRWGNRATFQYSPIDWEKVNDHAIKVAAPPFFFEREILDLNKLSKWKDEHAEEEIHKEDLCEAFMYSLQRELQNSIWDPICAFGIGFAFFASCLLSVKYVNLRRKRTDAKIIKLGLQSEFCNSLYKLNGFNISQRLKSMKKI